MITNKKISGRISGILCREEMRKTSFSQFFFLTFNFNSGPSNEQSQFKEVYQLQLCSLVQRREKSE
jgi:hypothetical protein